MRKSIFLALILSVMSLAFAFPPLQVYQQGPINIRIPSNWAVNYDAANGAISIVEDPNNQASPFIFWATQTNSNNLSPQAVVEQSINNILNSGLSDYQLISSENIQGGVAVIFSGYKQNQLLKTAIIVYANQDSLTMAMFSAPANRFDELGGIALIYVTVGGYDPADFAQQDTIGGSAANNNSGCFDPNDIMYEFPYCGFARAKANGHTPVDSSFIIGDWTYAEGVPFPDQYQDTNTGEISQDSMGGGVNIIFHPNGSYDIILLTSSTFNFCTNILKGSESGQYSFDGEKIRLFNANYEASSSLCGGAEAPFSGKVIDNTAEFVYLDRNSMFVKLDCKARGYMEDSLLCNDNGENYLKLFRKN